MAKLADLSVKNKVGTKLEEVFQPTPTFPTKKLTKLEKLEQSWRYSNL